jgi:hexosaminidase
MMFFSLRFFSSAVGKTLLSVVFRLTQALTRCSGGKVQLRGLWITLAALHLTINPLFTPLASSQAVAAGKAQLPVMPLPFRAVPASGEFLLDGGFEMVFTGYTEPRLERAKLRFFETLKSQTGIRRWPPSAQKLPQFIVNTKAPGAPVQQLGEDESYYLDVTPAQVSLTAANPLGVLRGLQTFLQLVHISPKGFVVNAIAIEDKPRFPWRGLMIDAGRHFIPIEVMRQNLDAMEAVKLNILHWHVSEDQGFRIESRVFPQLQRMGSDGLFYTQDEVRGIIAYARDRGIRVMPEFEMPSHANSLYVGYPELADGTGPYHLKRKFGEKWGRDRKPSEDSSMDPTRESTYVFLDRLLGEMSNLFPDAYLHVGGDAEDAVTEWSTNPRIQQYMRDNGFKDSAALQTYFTARLQKLVSKHHKTMVGWDEVLQPETPKDVVIQSWRGLDSLATAVGRGNRAILSWGYYLDLNEPASRHYAVDPLAGSVGKLTLARQSEILGGETAMWTEYVTPETIDGRIWPRAAAVAERLWSQQNVTDPDSMYTRLAALSQYLTYRGIPYEAIRELTLQRMVGNGDPTPLKVLASIVEPPRGFPREGQREYDVYTPLNHLSDIIPAEADSAREFHNATARIAAGDMNPANLRFVRQSLTLWRDNDVALQPLLPLSSITAELVPVSHNLSQAAEIGLQALDSIEKKEAFSASQSKETLATLESINKPIAELTDKVIPDVEILVLAATH